MKRGVSLGAAALPAERRVLSRWGWAGEKSGLSEQLARKNDGLVAICEGLRGLFVWSLKAVANTVPSPAYAGSHGCQAVEECTAGVLRSLGEGGHASAGSAEDTKETTAVKPWGSTSVTTYWGRVRRSR